VIVSLPRSGSTTLARLLDSHDDVRCIVEPFHPHRYGGHFHQFARRRSVGAAFSAIWAQWTAVKHVWDLNGFPFFGRPELNDETLIHAGCRVILLVRRNILRRIVSQHLSRQTRYWIGPREGFIAKLSDTSVVALDPWRVCLDIRAEQEALASQTKFLAEHDIPFLRLDYEDLFRPGASVSDQASVLNDMLSFVGLAPFDRDGFIEKCTSHLDRNKNQWATEEVYRRIPDIERLEDAAGSDITGWLFR
jgi:LPS sulfotransferase NodH